jgi:hypothetical protein
MKCSNLTFGFMSYYKHLSISCHPFRNAVVYVHIYYKINVGVEGDFTNCKIRWRLAKSQQITAELVSKGCTKGGFEASSKSLMALWWLSFASS